MPKIRRYTPQVAAPDSAGTVQVPMSLANVSDASSRALQTLGDVAGTIGDKIQKLEYADQISTAQAEYQKRLGEFNLSLDGMNPKEYGKAWEKAKSKISGDVLKGISNPRASKDFMNSLKAYEADQDVRVSTKYLTDSIKLAKTSEPMKRAAFVTSGDKQAYLNYLNETGIFNGEEVGQLSALYDQDRNEFEIKATYQYMIDSGYSKDATRDRVVDLFKSKGVDLDTREKIISSMNGYAAGARKAQEQTRSVKQLEAVKALSESMKGGNVNYDMVDPSVFNDAEVASLREIIDAATMDITDPGEPRKSKLNGAYAFIQNTMKYSAGQMSTQEYYVNAMKHRFLDRDIDDATYEWALSKIDNRYPPGLANAISSRFIENEYSAFGDKAEKEAYDHNMLLVSEIDGMINSGVKVTPEDVYRVSSEIQSGNYQRKFGTQTPKYRVYDASTSKWYYTEDRSAAEAARENGYSVLGLDNE